MSSGRLGHRDKKRIMTNMIEFSLLFMEESNQVLLVGEGFSAHGVSWTVPFPRSSPSVASASEKRKSGISTGSSSKAMAQI